MGEGRGEGEEPEDSESSQGKNEQLFRAVIGPWGTQEGRGSSILFQTSAFCLAELTLDFCP